MLLMVTRRVGIVVIDDVASPAVMNGVVVVELGPA